MNIAHRIKLLRIENNLSQAILAQKLGVSPGNVGDWERQRSKPSSKALMAICNYFQIPYNWLINGDSRFFSEKGKKSFENAGNRLEFTLFFCNISKYKLSQQLEISLAVLEDFFHNKYPSPQIFNDICNTLNVDPEWILGYCNEINSYYNSQHSNFEYYDIIMDSNSKLSFTYLLSQRLQQNNLSNSLRNRINICYQFDHNSSTNLIDNKFNYPTEVSDLNIFAKKYNILLSWLLSGDVLERSSSEIDNKYEEYITTIVSPTPENINIEKPNEYDKYTTIDNNITDSLQSSYNSHSYTSDENLLIRLYRELPAAEKEFITDFLSFRVTKHKNTKCGQ